MQMVNWLVWSFWQFNMNVLSHNYDTHTHTLTHTHTHTHTHPFNSLWSGTTQVSRYQKGKTNLDFTGARDSAWQWHQLEHMQVCTSLQTDNHAVTPPLSFLQAGCPSCRPTNSVKALKANCRHYKLIADITSIVNFAYRFLSVAISFKSYRLFL